MKTLTSELLPAWFIEASTGCSCCSNENFTCGPFWSPADAEERKQSFIRTSRLASQYARNGIYNIEQKVVEKLSDGRCIVGDAVWEDYEERGRSW
jgi:hypothetical protein